MPTATGQGVKAYATFRFYVSFGAETHAVFTECSGLQVEVETTDWEEGGVNEYVHKVLGRIKYQPLVLRSGIITSSELWKWYKDVLNGRLKPRSVTISLYDPEGKTVAEWTFNEALPVKWTGPTLKADENASTVESLELVHKGLQLR